MELLGRAQVDMREAPDARVVLEVTLVRVARVDLDPSVSALAERVARLEQALAAGGAPSPSAPRPEAEPAPVRSPGARPTLGAVRKERQAAAPPPAPAAEEAPPAALVEEPVVAGEPPDRDTLVEAWGDHILRSLPPLAKALYSAGRFLSVEDGTATFAVANAPHRDRCADMQPAVEDALASYFGVRVPIRLVLDTESDTKAAAAGPGRSAGGPVSAAETDGADLGDDDFDPDAPGVTIEIDTLVQARLLEAFPGAEEVRP
jgi:DNA polymerase-3 subunit gamma/tau